MSFQYQWQTEISDSGVQEVLALAAALKNSGLFNEHELAPIQAELKALVLVQARGLIAGITNPKEVSRMPPQLKEHQNKVHQQLLKLNTALGPE